MILFFGFWLWLMLKPEVGLKPLLLEIKNIDSIEMDKSGEIISITDTKEIEKITNALQKSILTTPEKIKLSSDFTELNFFINGKNENENIRMMSNEHDGVLFNSNYSYYKNESLYQIISSFIERGN